MNVIVSLARAVLRGIKDFAPDALHIQSTLSVRRDWALCAGIQLKGNPLVFTTHNIVPCDQVERSAHSKRLAYNLVYSIVDWIIVRDEGPKRDLLRAYRTDPDRALGRRSPMPMRTKSIACRNMHGK